MTDHLNRKHWVDELPERCYKEASRLAERIVFDGQQSVMEFGLESQEKMNHFIHSMLEEVGNRKSTNVNEVLKKLMDKLTEVDVKDLFIEEASLFKRLFSSSVNEVLSKYQRIGAEMDKMGVRLNRAKEELSGDYRDLEALYRWNASYYDELTVYLAVGEWKYEKLHEEFSALDPNSWSYEDKRNVLELLERRLDDLQTSRQIAWQTGPQIRMIQRANETLIESIQSSILTTIPLWKNQIAMALTLFHQRKAGQSKKGINKTTNTLLNKTTSLFASDTRDADTSYESIQSTQRQLLQTIEDTLHREEDGKQQRLAAKETIATMRTHST
ncbi:hypothetical protein N781_15695 [Pontibacillus halophilus JSM 076056 = DSM 19796]|uniref:Tellurite resistance protein n=1 Tax=Pontibacillus halophilus JSM 076056 = DSM 19796 TaxID=1385510 RepID=A0A0A5IAE5_9BACI|nr:toxic anion resistance protein [Pontibacillus halophilus]KGX92807.1 hypothetical protein N781_15695 [Pontibacillus halophilus JSM 076056 = DSM 19796]